MFSVSFSVLKRSVGGVCGGCENGIRYVRRCAHAETLSRPNHPASSSRTCRCSSSSSRSGRVPITETLISDLPAGAYDEETSDGTQQLLTMLPLLSPSRYR